MKQSLLESIKLTTILWLARRLPDCKTITPKLGESLDRNLDLWTRLIMKLHLFTCGPCRRYLHQIKFVKEAVRMAAEHLKNNSDARVELSAEAKDRIKLRLSAATDLA